MHPTERALIRAFNANPKAPHTTSELVKDVFPDEYATIREDLANNNTTRNKQAKKTKAKLHRQLLYYLNKLTDKGILEVASIQERGEKSYQLSIKGGELILKDKNETITISNTENPKNYLKENNQYTHQATTKLHKIEAYAINAQHYPGIAHLRADLNHAYSHVADALLIQNFQEQLQTNPEALKEGLNQLIADSQDYNIAITLHIDLTKHTLTNQDQQLINTYALHHPKRLYLLFSSTREELRKQHNQLAKATRALANNQIKVNLHNQSVDKNTHFTGTLGAYALTNEHTKQLQEQQATIIATGSIAIDCAEQPHANQLSTIAQNAVKTLLARATIQRRISARALTGLSTIEALKKQLATNNTYLRLWNYTQDENTLALITTLHEEIKALCELESRIYSSCGVPINFTTHLSTAFSHYAQLSTRSYNKKPVYERANLKNQRLSIREQFLRIFTTDRVRVFREGNFTSEELLSELLYIADNYELPLITYDFKELQKTISLENFL